MGVKCKFNGCTKSASYNVATETKVLYCSEHKLDNMIDVKHNKCLEANCNKNPYFNYSDKKVGLYCIDHALPNMINIKSKRCILCDKHASFGITKPTHCFDHKLDGMSDVVHKKCLIKDCKLVPVFNFPNETSGLYCSIHKLENMIDVKHNKCNHAGCMKSPHFNYTNEKTAIYCSEHKLENMINVITKTCIYENCKTIPFYNFSNQTSGLYCNLHKLDGMIDVKSRRCKSDECTKRPIYNLLEQPNGLYCKDHKLKDMIDVVNKRCKMDLCAVRIHDNKYDGYCLFCYAHLFPDKKISTNYKTKEREVVNFVLTTFNDKTWIIDKKINDGCSKRRPDLLLDLGYQVIIVEIDENQHIKYDCSCDNKRLMEISQDLGHRNIIFIRFNPDDYINNKNIKMDSCWKLNSKGNLILYNKENWTTRLNSLKDQIEYWISNKTDKMIEIIQLYYDGFD